MGTGDWSTCDTGLSIAVNRSETGPRWRRNKTVSTAGLTMSVKCADQIAISKWRFLFSGHFHYAQKPSEHRETGQGTSI